MKKDIIKLSGCKSEAEFYKKYPTEEAFLNDKHIRVEAKQLLKQYRSGGSINPEYLHGGMIPGNFAYPYETNQRAVVSHMAPGGPMKERNLLRVDPVPTSTNGEYLKGADGQVYHKDYNPLEYTPPNFKGDMRRKLDNIAVGTPQLQEPSGDPNRGRMYEYLYENPDQPTFEKRINELYEPTMFKFGGAPTADETNQRAVVSNYQYGGPTEKLDDNIPYNYKKIKAPTRRLSQIGPKYGNVPFDYNSKPQQNAHVIDYYDNEFQKYMGDLPNIYNENIETEYQYGGAPTEAEFFNYGTPTANIPRLMKQGGNLPKYQAGQEAEEDDGGFDWQRFLSGAVLPGSLGFATISEFILQQQLAEQEAKANAVIKNKHKGYRVTEKGKSGNKLKEPRLVDKSGNYMTKKEAVKRGLITAEEVSKIKGPYIKAPEKVDFSIMKILKDLKLPKGMPGKFGVAGLGAAGTAALGYLLAPESNSGFDADAAAEGLNPAPVDTSGYVGTAPENKTYDPSEAEAIINNLMPGYKRGGTAPAHVYDTRGHVNNSNFLNHIQNNVEMNNIQEKLSAMGYEMKWGGSRSPKKKKTVTVISKAQTGREWVSGFQQPSYWDTGGGNNSIQYPDQPQMTEMMQEGTPFFNYDINAKRQEDIESHRDPRVGHDYGSPEFMLYGDPANKPGRKQEPLIREPQNNDAHVKDYEKYKRDTEEPEYLTYWDNYGERYTNVGLNALGIVNSNFETSQQWKDMDFAENRLYSGNYQGIGTEDKGKYDPNTQGFDPYNMGETQFTGGYPKMST